MEASIKDSIGTFGVAANLFKNLANAVKDEGGTWEDLRRLEDKKLCRKLAEVIVEGRKAIRAAFTVSVDYAKTLPEMIAAGKYDWKNEDITEANFPQTHAEEVIDTTIEFVHLNRDASTDEALRYLEAEGLRPATLEELLALGEKHPDLQRDFPIIALGSVWQYSCGDRRVPCLGRGVAGRILYLGWIEGGWGGFCRFAAVRKS